MIKLENVKSLEEVYSIEDCENLIKNGWFLLNMRDSSTVNKYGSKDSTIIFTLGSESPPVPLPKVDITFGVQE